MRMIRLDRFPDGKLVDDLIVDRTEVRLTRIGAARFELRFALTNNRELLATLSTSKKGVIATRTDPAVLQPIPGVLHCVYLADGSLQSFHVYDCGAHLEHMDRGHYWLGLYPEKYTPMHVNFCAPGRIKTVADEVAASSAQ